MGVEKAMCSVHNKQRSVDHLIDDGAGGKRCGEGESACMGGAATETAVCSVHGRKRTVDHLIDDGAGGKKCAPGESECDKGTKRKGSGNGCKWCQQGECWTHNGQDGHYSKGDGKGGNWGGSDVQSIVAAVMQAMGKGGGGGGGKGGNWGGNKGGGGDGGFNGNCNNCGQFGHKGANCPQGGGGGGFNGTCNICGEHGHKASSCSQGPGGGSGGNKPKDPALTVWVGNIPEGITAEEIRENFKQAGNVTRCNITKGGTGIVQYSQAGEAQAAISMFNGSVVNGSALHVDAWTKKD